MPHRAQGAAWDSALAGHRLGGLEQEEVAKRLMLERFQAEVRAQISGYSTMDFLSNLISFRRGAVAQFE